MHKFIRGGHLQIDCNKFTMRRIIPNIMFDSIAKIYLQNAQLAFYVGFTAAISLIRPKRPFFSCALFYLAHALIECFV